jgi:hypothetical protein
MPVPAGAADAAFAPFAIADVDFEPDCAPNPAFNRLLTLLFGLGSFPDNAAAFDEPLHNALAGDTHHVLRLDRAAEWHGLRLVEVRADFGIERGPANLALVFADDPARVREVWNARGWNLPPTGESRVIDHAVIRIAVGIESDGSLSAVTCFAD